MQAVNFSKGTLENALPGEHRFFLMINLPFFHPLMKPFGFNAILIDRTNQFDGRLFDASIVQRV